jgi:hypothetical protein
MFDRFNAMELEMEKLKQEIITLKSEKKLTLENDEVENETEAITNDADEPQEESEEEEMNLQEEIEEIYENLSDLNKATSGNHLKLSVDYRFTLENLQYKMADGSTPSNDAFMTNRFWLNMNWAATDNLSFTGQLAYNKAFGARSGVQGHPANSFDTFDWIANENAYDDTLRIRSAYFLYRNDTFFDTEVPWTFSIGRRPSTNGHLINLRDDDPEASPMGHSINVEFDGLSSKFNFEDVTGIDGMYIKLCAGRGMSNAAPKFAAAPYANVESANSSIDLLGIIFRPYSDGQYSVSTQYYFANNLIDSVNPSNPALGMKTVGGMHSFTGNIVINGIGNEINDFLDDSILFASGAISITDPNESGGGMLGSTESQTGYSAWIGVQMPSLMSEDGRMGFEYNKGSAYWRSITYGEDTNIGSKVAARGDAYEAYFTEYLVDDILSLQLRYTYIDYKYSGSNGFFGSTTGASQLISNISDPMAAQVVDTAQDIRFYLRYKY